MKFSEQWLREWVNPAIDTAALAEQLTMAGLEVDATEPVAGEFSGVVVAEIVSAEPHPDADKLQVCQVNSGAETVQIVCGAANARVGIKVPLATVGAVLPGNFKIKKAKLRGVESFGMLCAEEELGMAAKSDGLLELAADAPVGECVRQYLSLDDTLIELDLTPNRADCLSLRGVARETAVLNHAEFTELTVVASSVASDASMPVRIDAEELCPRYAGRMLNNVDCGKPSPAWLVERLRRSGLRSVDAVVDVTNLVMLELGQPLHAFDVAKVDTGIVVRMAEEGESLTLLGGEELALRADSLVIADHSGALALAGVMGGESSGVSSQTKDIFLEAAFFAPESIAGKARSYGLHTDSSHRFERGVDYAQLEKALERATGLIQAICGGDAAAIAVVETGKIADRAVISLREQRIEKMLGVAIPAEQVESILRGLGMELESTGERVWSVTAPSWRFDIAIEADLLEELARIYGYNNLPVKPICDQLTLRSSTESKRGLSAVKQQMVARGYQEAITYSFIDPEMHAAFSAGAEAVELLNPISSDMAVMRTSLFMGLVKAAAYNCHRQQSRVRLFESGLRFEKNQDGVRQVPTFAALITGRRHPENWSDADNMVDYFDLKGDLEALLSSTGQSVAFKSTEHAGLHPGQCADIYCNDEKVGRIAALHPSLKKKLDLAQPLYMFEIDQAALLVQQVPEFAVLSRFPEVRRDLAFIVAEEIDAQTILNGVRESAGEHLVNLKLFDIYQGKGVDPERKSIALGLTFRHSSRTLNEDEVNQSVESVVQKLQGAVGASLRD